MERPGEVERKRRGDAEQKTRILFPGGCFVEDKGGGDFLLERSTLQVNSGLSPLLETWTQDREEKKKKRVEGGGYKVREIQLGGEHHTVYRP